MSRLARFKVPLALVTLLMGGFAYWITTDVIEQGRVSESMHLADLIGSALNEYHEKFGNYPDTLDALVPDFIDAIPAPTAGNRKWMYDSPGSVDNPYVPVQSEESKKGYALGFEGDNSSYPTYIYKSWLDDWWIDTK